MVLLSPDLSNDTVMAGMSPMNDLNFADMNVPSEIQSELSAIHFEIKKDLSHNNNPVFIEVITLRHIYAYIQPTIPIYDVYNKP